MAGVWIQAVSFFVGGFGKNVASVAVKFSHLISLKINFIYASL